MIQIIKDNHLFDFQRISDLLKNSSFKVKLAGLEVSILDKAEYVAEDINSYEKLKDIINQQFSSGKPKKRGCKRFSKAKYLEIIEDKIQSLKEIFHEENL